MLGFGLVSFRNLGAGVFGLGVMMRNFAALVNPFPIILNPPAPNIKANFRDLFLY